MTKDQAKAIAAPHLAKEGNDRVFVNQHGLYWINNEPEQMAEYFKKKGEAYFMFDGSEDSPEQPEGDGKQNAKKQAGKGGKK